MARQRLNPYNEDEEIRKQVVADLAGPDQATLPVSGTPGERIPGPSAEAADPFRTSVNQLYQKNLGRDAGEPDYLAHAKNPYGIGGVEQAIFQSPEYASYLAKGMPPYQSSSTLAPSATAAGAKTGWGFNSPTGGRAEFSYTPGQYEGDIGDYSGYDAAKIGQNDSIKYVWLEATRGLPVSVDSLPEIVSRLNAMGIPAKQVGYDLIDFGLGEGPVDVVNQTLGGKWDWMPTNAPGGAAGGGGSTPTPTVATGGDSVLGGDALSRIQALLQQLMAQGYSRDTLLSLMTSGGPGFNG